jgi:two-component system, OmpR family, alkaline phosphatase synthesis response regulator PhoP
MAHILVIEDDPIVRSNIEDILILENFQVTTAVDGVNGIECAKRIKPDLIICDIMMPHLDGYGVLDALRHDDATQHIPFIFLTAKSDRSDFREGMDSGADDYLTKPFRPTEVINAIKARLARNAFNQLETSQQQAVQKALERQRDEQVQLSEIKENLLSQLTEDLREPLSNINLALHMLSHAKTEEERNRYIDILRQEYNREMRLLENTKTLKDMITPQNINLLRQFNLIKGDNP